MKHAEDQAGHGHDADHEHSHERGHAHGAVPERLDARFALAIGLNLVFVIVEATYGYLANSVALIADAGHNFSDVIGLVAAWAAVWLGRRPASTRYTYGLQRSSVLAALANAILLLVACGAIAWEAIHRFSAPTPVQGTTMMVVAAIGIAINVGAALLLNAGKQDLNLRGAFLHMIADAAVSAGVVLSGALILWTGWLWLDPVVSLVIVAVIVVGTWGLFRESVRMSLDAVPQGIDVKAVERFLREQPGVSDVHDLHVWGLSTSRVALTAHVVRSAPSASDEFVTRTAAELETRFRIAHVTLQLEATPCAQGCGPDRLDGTPTEAARPSSSR
jgi:cobalt-zinc-cadmium efflux system protein